MGVAEHLRVIWRRKWRVLAVSIVLAGVVYARSDSRPDEYRADALLAVTPAAGPERDDAARFLARGAAALAETRSVAADAVRTARLSVSPSDAADRVSASADGDVGFLTVTAVAEGQAAAEKLAQAVAVATVDAMRNRQEAARRATVDPAEAELRTLEEQLAARELPPDAPRRDVLRARHAELTRGVVAIRLQPFDRAEIVSPARARSTPVSPTPAKDALLALLAALVVNSLVAVLIEALSDRFSTERPTEEVSRVTGLPVLAQIPRGTGPEVVEAFRALRTSLMFMSTSERLRTMAVVSVDPGTGKSFCAVNLAREAAGLGVPVVLIDGDLRRPVLHDHLKLPRSPGLSEALAAGQPVDELGHPVERGLRVITSGSPVADPAGLFGGREFRATLEAMTWAELVVVDTPAAGLFADAMAIASQCDATLLVVDVQSTRRRAVRSLVEGLRRVSAQPIGVVLNRTEPLGRAAYYEAPKKTRRTQPPAASATAASRPRKE